MAFLIPAVPELFFCKLRIPSGNQKELKPVRNSSSMVMKLLFPKLPFPKLPQCQHLSKQWWPMGRAFHCVLKGLSALSALLLEVKFSEDPSVQATWLQDPWKSHRLESATEPTTKSRRGAHKCQEEEHHFWGSREEKRTRGTLR